MLLKSNAQVVEQFNRELTYVKMAIFIWIWFIDSNY